MNLNNITIPQPYSSISNLNNQIPHFGGQQNTDANTLLKGNFY